MHKATRHIVEVCSNIRSPDGQPWTVRLGPRTLLLGPPESGKTRTLNAIELALTGRASEVLFRDATSESLLAALVPPNVDIAYANVKFDDGTEALWSMAIVDGKPKRASRELPEWLNLATTTSIFPVRAVQEALLMGVDACTRFFLGALSLKMTTADVRSGFDEEDLVAFDEVSNALYDAGTLPEDPTLWPSAVRDEAAKQERALAAEYKALRRTLDGMHNIVEVTPSEVDAARARMEKATDGSDDGVDYASLRRALTTYRASVIKIEELTGLIEHNEKVACTLVVVPPDNDIIADLEAVERTIVLSLKYADGPIVECLCCGAIPDFSSTLEERRADTLTLLAAKRKEMRAAEQAWRTATEVVHRSQEALPLLHSQLSLASNAMRNAAKELVDAGFNPEGTDFEDFEAPPNDEARAASEAYALVQSGKALWDQALDLRGRAAAASKGAATMKSLVEACNSRVADLFGRAVGAFETAVSRYLAEGETARVVRDLGGLDSFVLARAKDGIIHTASTGSVGARLLMAAAAAICEHAEFGVIVPPDKAMSAEVLREAMKALDKAPIQVVLQSVVRPAGKMWKDWTIVELGEVTP
jgi:hypothetical protein